jgi:ABC-type transport system involved in cytochrome bd biosynthesis fused ATPase/permease subunit
MCLGALPGYDELCKRRQLLRPAVPAQQGRTATSQNLASLNDSQNWIALHWSPATAGKEAERVELKPGTLVAVAGPSGSGKTTLLDRVCGLLGEDSSQWQITSSMGAIALSGSAGARQLRGLLAYAPQEAVLFETSLRQNLLLDQEAPACVIEDWLERLGLSHLCKRGSGLDDPLPLALDHFSGGEIHRLGLLRAWLRNRPVEVLDEPTAFLDAESAQRVRAILAERARERLVLVSTHDPELIKQAGKVLRLQVSDRQQAERLHHG